MKETNNLRVTQLKPLTTPAELLQKLPLTQAVSKTIAKTRQQIAAVLHDEDPRLIVVVGPCSIHDPKAAIDYATQLKRLIDAYSDELHIVMRVYFEKPRTTVGWKGLINDPSLDEKFDINKGLELSRDLLLKINSLGVTTGSEFLDTIIPQYISDLTAWSAIGARTSESQIHRELASGLSMPVGFKNGTTGSVQIAVDAVNAARSSHHFLGISQTGIASIVRTAGNKNCHLILRGSNEGPNYDKASVQATEALLRSAQLNAKIMVDCSHGNSRKQHEKQIEVVRAVSEQIIEGNTALCGVMIESNLVAGKQSLKPNQPLTYGQSITDACVNLTETKNMLEILSNAIKKRKAA